MRGGALGPTVGQVFRSANRLGRVLERLPDVLGLEIGIRVEDLLPGHPVRHPIHHRDDGNTQSPDTGNAAHLAGIDSCMRAGSLAY